jgi:hypothetical protein
LYQFFKAFCFKYMCVSYNWLGWGPRFNTQHQKKKPRIKRILFRQLGMISWEIGFLFFIQHTGPLLLSTIIIYLFFCGTGVWTQSLVLLNLHHRITIPKRSHSCLPVEVMKTMLGYVLVNPNKHYYNVLFSS